MKPKADMDSSTSYYRFPIGSVIVRRTGDKIEKKGRSGVWQDAPELLWRFVSGDDALIEISPEEAGDFQEPL